MASLANKVGIVTGGGTGIGRATALAMARAGASVVIGNRGAKLGEEVVGAIEQTGGNLHFVARSYFPGLGAHRQRENAQSLVEIRRCLGTLPMTTNTVSR